MAAVPPRPYHKVVLVGDTGVGKSTLLMRYMNDTFSTELQATIGIDFVWKSIPYGGATHRFQLWDLSGNEKFRSLTASYLRNAKIAFICVDVTDPTSWESLEYWINRIRESAIDLDLVSIVGCKSDTGNEREVSKEEAQKKADDLGYPYFETSAKTGEGVSNLFNDTARRLHEKLEEESRAVNPEEGLFPCINCTIS